LQYNFPLCNFSEFYPAELLDTGGVGGRKERHYEPKSRLWIENILQGKQSCHFGIEKSYRLALESFNCSVGRTTQLIGREMFTIPVTHASSVHFHVLESYLENRANER
jgi:hypothetical protein